MCYTSINIVDLYTIYRYFDFKFYPEMILCPLSDKGCMTLKKPRISLPHLNLATHWQTIILVSNIICFGSKTLLLYQNATNYSGSDENLPIENLWDKIFEFLFISYVTCVSEPARHVIRRQIGADASSLNRPLGWLPTDAVWSRGW